MQCYRYNSNRIVRKILVSLLFHSRTAYRYHRLGTSGLGNITFLIFKQTFSNPLQNYLLVLIGVRFSYDNKQVTTRHGARRRWSMSSSIPIYTNRPYYVHGSTSTIRQLTTSLHRHKVSMSLSVEYEYSVTCLVLI